MRRNLQLTAVFWEKRYAVEAVKRPSAKHYVAWNIPLILDKLDLFERVITKRLHLLFSENRSGVQMVYKSVGTVCISVGMNCKSVVTGYKSKSRELQMAFISQLNLDYWKDYDCL